MPSRPYRSCSILAIAWIVLSLLAACELAESDSADPTTRTAQEAHQHELDALISARKAGESTLDQVRDFAAREEIRSDHTVHVLALHEWGLIHELVGQVDSAQALYALARLESIQYEDTAGLGHSYFQFGTMHRFQGEHDLALLYYDSAMAQYDYKGMALDKARALFGIGVVKDYTGEFKASTDHFFQALSIAESERDSTLIANCYNSLGILFTRSEQWDESILHYRRSRDLMRKMGDLKGVGNSIDNIGDAHRLAGHYDSALVYAREALALRRSIADRRGLGRGLNNIGLVHLLVNELDSAEMELTEAVRIFESIDDQHSMVSCLNRLATLYQRKSAPDKALATAGRALEIAQALGSSNEEMYVHKNLVGIHEHFGGYELALDHFKQYHALKDSLLSEQNTKNLNELETKYQSERKDKQLAEQERNLAMEQSRVKQRNIWIVLTAALLLILGLVSWSQKRNFEQKRNLEQARIKQLESERKIGFAEAMISGQEIERSRIAKDLHDGLGAILATAKLQLEQVQEGIKQLEQLRISEKTTELLDTAYSEVRRISHDMMPASLERFGLEEALASLCRQLTSASLESKLDSDLGKQRLPSDLEFALFRIAQEASNNVLKYAEASALDFRLRKTSSHIALRISDDGVGFDPEQISHAGLGLKNMESRAGFFGGTVAITSSPGAGCRIDVHIPLPDHG